MINDYYCYYNYYYYYYYSNVFCALVALLNVKDVTRLADYLCFVLRCTLLDH